MIKINLLTSRISSFGGAAQGITFDTSGGAEDRKDAIKKVVYMLMFSIMLMVYESYNLDDLQDQLRKLRAEDSSQKANIAILKKKAGRAPEMEKEVKKMEEKLEIVTGLSKKRLRELKALDFLQNLIPESVWLKSMKYDGENVFFAAEASNDEDMNFFVEGLDKSVQFEEVILIKAVEKKSKTGTIKVFEVESKLGVVD
ncbi:MAG: PilN domain-containing protein [Bdellovibrionaceae bacterium]|jgi:Tfp pilus assembly protein PilN|nr:PilN domain-containing protein [Pseudobdellovibrionaceae bacterium]